MSAEHCFADTNIWFYAFVCGENSDEIRKHEIAKNLLETEPGLSVQVINEISSNLLRKASYPEDRLRNLLRSLYQRYTVHSLTPEIFIQASDLREKYAFSYWDSLIVATALENDYSVLYSEDMQHGQIIEASLTIQNPFKEKA